MHQNNTSGLQSGPRQVDRHPGIARALPALCNGTYPDHAQLIQRGLSHHNGGSPPLLLIAGFTQSVNYDLFSERMMSLPVFVYTQYAYPGTEAQAYLDRAWAGALTLIVIVMVLNLVARLIAKIFSPKLGR